jgi:hypothetical protein
MHQVSAFFLHRLGEGLQAGGFDRLRGGGDLRVYRCTAPASFPGVIKNVQLDLGGHALERLETRTRGLCRDSVGALELPSQ